MPAGRITGQLKLPRDWQDPEYRHEYARATAEQKLCWQIRVTRIKRGMTKSELAKKAKVHRNTIARYEGHSNCNANEEIRMSTLLKIARALDVAICIELRSFSSLGRERRDLSETALNIPPFPG